MLWVEIKDGKLVTRRQVLGVTATAPTLKEALARLMKRQKNFV
ncbi:MAG: hypothetical protein ACLR56_03375 [Oscillospiraceae bacterium]